MLELSSIADLDALLADAKTPLVLFKHSTRCPISAGALREYHRFVEEQGDAARFTYLDLIAHRDVSDEIADRLDVPHESPQAIVMRDGKISGVLTHTQIRGASLEELLAGR